MNIITGFVLVVLAIIAVAWTWFWIRHFQRGPWATISVIGVREFNQGFLATIYIPAIRMSSHFWFDKSDVKNAQTPLVGKSITVLRSVLRRKGLI